MRSRLIALVVLFALAIGVWWLWPSPAPPAEQAAKSSAPTQTASAAAKPASAAPTPPETRTAPAPEHARAEARQRRDALRKQIVDAGRAEAPDPAHAAPEQPETSQGGGLKDRIGGRDDLMAALNADFLPLADECIEAARERDPELMGMLALGMEVIGDEDLGAVIENVDFPDRNEVIEAELLECIRETAYSTTLPPPPESGRDEFLITLKVGIE